MTGLMDRMLHTATAAIMITPTNKTSHKIVSTKFTQRPNTTRKHSNIKTLMLQLR